MILLLDSVQRHKPCNLTVRLPGSLRFFLKTVVTSFAGSCSTASSLQGGHRLGFSLVTVSSRVAASPSAQLLEQTARLRSLSEVLDRLKVALRRPGWGFATCGLQPVAERGPWPSFWQTSGLGQGECASAVQRSCCKCPPFPVRRVMSG